MEGGNRQRKLRTLRADKRLTDFDIKTGPAVDFS